MGPIGAGHKHFQLSGPGTGQPDRSLHCVIALTIVSMYIAYKDGDKGFLLFSIDMIACLISGIENGLLPSSVESVFTKFEGPKKSKRKSTSDQTVSTGVYKSE